MSKREVVGVYEPVALIVKMALCHFFGVEGSVFAACNWCLHVANTAAACALGVELFEYECCEFAAVLSRCECLRFPDPMAVRSCSAAAFTGILSIGDSGGFSHRSERTRRERSISTQQSCRDDTLRDDGTAGHFWPLQQRAAAL